MGIADLLKDKKSKAIFPDNPQDASPELYPPKPTIKKPDFLNNKNVQKKGDEFIYARKI